MSTKIVTGEVRFSYCNIWEPKEPTGGGEPKYSVTLLIPKTDTDTINKCKQAMKEAADNFRARNGANSLPQHPVTSFYDGDGTRKNGDPFGDECKGCYVITVSSKQQPVIVDASRNVVLNQADVYSGCYGRASINFFGYNSNGNKGISAGLLAIQKLRDGEPFGTVGSANDFDDGFQTAGAGVADDWM